MSKIVNFDLYINIEGEVEVDEYNGDPNELLDAIFPKGWNGIIMDAFTNPQFMPNGHVEVTEVDDEEDEEDVDCEENNCEACTYDCDTCPNNGDCIRQNE